MFKALKTVEAAATQAAQQAAAQVVDEASREGHASVVQLLVAASSTDDLWSASVAAAGCRELMKLAKNDDNKKSIAENGGIEAIHGVMDKHGTSNAGVAEYGCRALKNLAGSNADNKKRIGEAGGIAMILSMMEEHGKFSAGIALYGCCALWNLAYNNADNKRKILAANGVSMVERMKATWASNKGVQAMAHGALRELHASGSEDETKSKSTTDGASTVSLISL